MHETRKTHRTHRTLGTLEIHQAPLWNGIPKKMFLHQTENMAALSKLTRNILRFSRMNMSKNWSHDE